MAAKCVTPRVYPLWVPGSPRGTVKFPRYPSAEVIASAVAQAKGQGFREQQLSHGNASQRGVRGSHLAGKGVGRPLCGFVWNIPRLAAPARDWCAQNEGVRHAIARRVSTTQGHSLGSPRQVTR